ncbi:peptidylprolyl isomerase [Plastorhodobacter daqingensis]|uniref:Parvulin-like PPIase n=1 Tax=Plastorhodobacter daqingensis TaxID=1387281 RepID=A0ABW2UHR1_9RHOB
MGTPLLADVTVNGVAIPAARIATEAQNHPAPQGKPGAAWRAAARALALREALLQEARARQLVPEPQELEPGQVETEEEALVRALLDQAIQPEAPSEAALRAIHAAHPDRFRAPPLWEAAHILIAAPPDDAAARADCRVRAMSLLQDVQAAPARFAELARAHSACSSREAGGLLGQIGPGDTVAAFESALRGLQAGQIAPEPVETRFGFHLIRLDAAAEGAVLPFEVVLPRLRAAAEKAAWVRAAKAFAEDLLARARLTGVPEVRPA